MSAVASASRCVAMSRGARGCVVVVLASILFAARAVAMDPSGEKACEVPEPLLSTSEELSRVAEAVTKSKKLDILVVGTGSSALGGVGAHDAAYPARMEFALRQAIAGVAVNVSTEILPRRTAMELSENLPKLVAERKPTLVVWQTGTIDAMRAVDLEDFRTALEEGIGAIQEAGADAVLMNMQYSPRTETIINASSYMDMMKAVAQQHDVVLFDRFAIMHHWSEAGNFDLYGAFHGLGMAKRVHDCIGRALSAVIARAARVGPAQPKERQ